MADPIRSNVLSNTCGEVTSSNCVAWAGPDLPGLGLCRGASMTDVIYSLNSNCCNQNLSSCYTGDRKPGGLPDWVYCSRPCCHWCSPGTHQKPQSAGYGNRARQ